MSNSRGFTLIELLVTISIISILSTIGLAMYSYTLKQGRDAKRQADLRTIQSALEQYYSDQFYYPTAITAGNPLSSGTKTYINTIPSDPTGNPQYYYQSLPSGCDNSPTNKCAKYCLYARLENSSSPAPNGCVYTGSYNFAVTLP